ncbi:hypothetical protein D4A47_12520 [Anaerotruncus massiliensis (ex Liu et al. 2021)]|uniref:Uncharacterized protein n=1 Tax=Anaerotruncus massiliensis (ex Liu et al. 2021) TaxID=2321404 RepID=A0A498CK21_9FIRM|nr:hypothetical protein D4A47_12520 [Anaerotruncus massiliensis (ex Liu et al. 2021)]
MLNRDARLFWVSFLLTLILTGWLALFLWVDTTSSRYENAAGVRALEIAPAGELRYSVALLGRQYTMSLEPFNAFEAWRQDHACLVTPRPLLLAQQGYGLLLRGWGSLDNWYKNYEYQQNVMKSQEGVPVEPDA